jgi:hypothetical protein
MNSMAYEIIWARKKRLIVLQGVSEWSPKLGKVEGLKSRLTFPVLPSAGFKSRNRNHRYRHSGCVMRNGADGAIKAAITELRPLGTFATWQVERVVGDHDRNTLHLRLDPEGVSP